MPVRITGSPFTKEVTKHATLRTPQARILAALVPADPTEPVREWRLLNRAMLSVRAGYTEISGSTTRALNGVADNGSVNKPHLGLLALGYVEEVVLDVEGVDEVNYRATRAGIAAYQEYVRTNGPVPQVRDRETCINNRYKNKNSTGEEHHGD